jgi:8-oxo-dGTP diphosphatase
MKKIEVVAAVIQHKGKILAVQRGPAKYDYISEKWEFPGGKMEAGESQEQTIIREIKEELDMEISVGPKLCVKPIKANQSLLNTWPFNGLKKVN